MRKIKLLTAAMVLAMAMCTLTACGGSDDKEEEKTTTAAVDVENDAEDDADEGNADSNDVEMNAKSLGETLVEGVYVDDDGAQFQFVGGAPVIAEAADGGSFQSQSPDGEMVEGNWNVCDEGENIVLYLTLGETQVAYRMTSVDFGTKTINVEDEQGKESFFRLVSEADGEDAEEADAEETDGEEADAEDDAE